MLFFPLYQHQRPDVLLVQHSRKYPLMQATQLIILSISRARKINFTAFCQECLIFLYKSVIYYTHKKALRKCQYCHPRDLSKAHSDDRAEAEVKIYMVQSIIIYEAEAKVVISPLLCICISLILT